MVENRKHPELDNPVFAFPSFVVKRSGGPSPHLTPRRGLRQEMRGNRIFPRKVLSYFRFRDNFNEPSLGFAEGGCPFCMYESSFFYVKCR